MALCLSAFVKGFPIQADPGEAEAGKHQMRVGFSFQRTAAPSGKTLRRMFLPATAFMGKGFMALTRITALLFTFAERLQGRETMGFIKQPIKGFPGLPLPLPAFPGRKISRSTLQIRPIYIFPPMIRAFLQVRPEGQLGLISLVRLLLGTAFISIQQVNIFISVPSAVAYGLMLLQGVQAVWFFQIGIIDPSCNKIAAF